MVPVDLSAHEVPQVLLDVREGHEREESMKHEGAMHVPLSQLSDAEGSLLPATDVPAELLSLFESVRDQRGCFLCFGCASAALCARRTRSWRASAGAPHGYLSVYEASLHVAIPSGSDIRVSELCEDGSPVGAEEGYSVQSAMTRGNPRRSYPLPEATSGARSEARTGALQERRKVIARLTLRESGIARRHQGARSEARAGALGTRANTAFRLTL